MKSFCRNVMLVLFLAATYMGNTAVFGQIPNASRCGVPDTEFCT